MFANLHPKIVRIFDVLRGWVIYECSIHDAQTNVFVALRILFLIIASILFFCVPSPGVGVAVLALVAACMSVHEHQTPYGKASWIFLLFALLSVELRAILSANRRENERLIRAREEQDREFRNIRKAQTDSFLATMAGINQSISESQSHFNKTIDVTNALLEKSEDLQRRSVENMNIATGGDSFAYMLFTPWGVPPYLKAKGKYPLHDLSVTIIFMDLRAGQCTNPIVHRAGGLGVGQMIQLISINLGLPDNDCWKVMTYFDALNGHWAQETEVKKIGNEWCEKLTVRRYDGDGNLKDIHSFVDPKLL